MMEELFFTFAGDKGSSQSSESDIGKARKEFFLGSNHRRPCVGMPVALAVSLAAADVRLGLLGVDLGSVHQVRVQTGTVIKVETAMLLLFAHT